MTSDTIKEQIRIVAIGHSHVASIGKAARRSGVKEQIGQAKIDCLHLLADEYRMPDKKKYDTPDIILAQHDLDALYDDVSRLARTANACLLQISGHEHTIAGLETRQYGWPIERAKQRVESLATQFLSAWCPFITPMFCCPIYLAGPPPPIESEDWIRNHACAFAEIVEQHGILEAEARRELWLVQQGVVRQYAENHHYEFLETPAEMLSTKGYLPETHAGWDFAHGNERCGIAVMTALLDSHYRRGIREDKISSKHPYSGLPDYSYWKQAVSDAPNVVDPVVNPSFQISQFDKIATAGSCFAQHIAKHLKASGYNFLELEKPGETEHTSRSTGPFSARYGNIYTSRQLLQLFSRAFGILDLELSWQRPDGLWIDPFRPTAFDNGFDTRDAMIAERKLHLAAVRSMFLEMDVFVFTLGLTECFEHHLSGAVFPVAPGVVGGSHNESEYNYLNLSVEEVVADLRAFLRKLEHVNKRCRVVITVSPVPLVATIEKRHVLVSTTYSKSVLRVAAGQIEQEFSNVSYFPSYEIITGTQAPDTFFEKDRRNVSAVGVKRVMELFMLRMTTLGSDRDNPICGALNPDERSAVEIAAQIACEEELQRKS